MSYVLYDNDQEFLGQIDDPKMTRDIVTSWARAKNEQAMDHNANLDIEIKGSDHMFIGGVNPLRPYNENVELRRALVYRIDELGSRSRRDILNSCWFGSDNEPVWSDDPRITAESAIRQIERNTT